MSEIKKGYKMTELGVIPEDWKIQNIYENATLKARIGWQGLTTAEYLNDGDYFLITGTDFFNGKIDWEHCHFVDKKRYIQDRNIQIKKSDILITKDGTIGKVAFIAKMTLNATLNSGVFVIRPKENAFDPLYLFYIFNSKYFDNFLKQLVAGSTINHLYQKDFISFKYPLPKSTPEQTAIAAVLSDTDALIEHMEKLIAKKKAVKQGAMQELLTGKKRLPGFRGEWKVRKLGEIFTITAGGDLDIKNFSLIQDEEYCYPIYSNALTNKGLYGFTSIYRQVENTLTVTARGQVGVANPRDHKYCAIGRVIMLNPLVDLNINFIAEYINNYVNFSNESTGVPQLTAPQIAKYEIPFPSPEEQTDLVRNALEV